MSDKKPVVAGSVLLALLFLNASAFAQVYPNARTGGNYMHNFYFPPAGSSTPWWPSWSPDGEWIAFAMDGSIWRIRPGETTAYEIVYAKEYLSSPEWSPDGNWLVYTADDDGQSINLMIVRFFDQCSVAIDEKNLVTHRTDLPLTSAQL